MKREIIVHPNDFEAAALYLHRLQSDGAWGRLPEKTKNVYRTQLANILSLCGYILPGSEWR
jgi:hypothetical protein